MLVCNVAPSSSSDKTDVNDFAQNLEEVYRKVTLGTLPKKSEQEHLYEKTFRQLRRHVHYLTNPIAE